MLSAIEGSGVGLARWYRLMPVAMVVYIISFMDRTNISYGFQGFAEDFHIDKAQQGFVAEGHHTRQGAPLSDCQLRCVNGRAVRPRSDTRDGQPVDPGQLQSAHDLHRHDAAIQQQASAGSRFAGCFSVLVQHGIHIHAGRPVLDCQGYMDTCHQQSDDV